MSTISSFTSIENKHDVYRATDCIKNFCEFLREHEMKITNFKKKNRKSCKYHMKMQKSVIFKKKIENKYLKDRKYCKVRNNWQDKGEYRGAVHSICNLKYSISKKLL